MLLFSSARVKGSRYLEAFRDEIPEAMHKAEDRARVRRDQGEEDAVAGEGKNLSAEPFNVQRGEPPPRAASPPRLWDAMMRLFHPPLPSGSDVT